MLLGFKRQFASFVEEGSKTHTIRGNRRVVPRVGEICHCYVDPRQKTMCLLGRWPCSRVEKIVISHTSDTACPLLISIAGVALTPEEQEVFLWRDGFRAPTKHIPSNPLSRFPSTQQAYAFWHDRLDESDTPGTWRGVVIHWKYA